MILNLFNSRIRFAPIFMCANLYAQSVWLPAPGQISATPSYTLQAFDSYQKGSASAKLSSPLVQQTGAVSFEAGISARLAADVTMGYSSVGATSINGGGPGRDSGITDTLVGLRWKLVDEETASHGRLPMLALRAGGIIQGTSTPNLVFSAGDGASGIEGSVLFGKDLRKAGAGAYGDFGFRHRNQMTPDTLFGSAGVYKNIGRASLSFGYRDVRSLTGMDIGDRGFVRQRLKVISHTIEEGLGFRVRGGHYFQLFAAQSAGGRNTGHKFVFGVATSFAFRPSAFHLRSSSSSSS